MEERIFLGRYRVWLEAGDLAQGAAGGPVIYQAEDLKTGKEMSVEVTSIAGLRLEDREKLEARARVAQLIQHRNIPAVRDFGVADHRFICVTKFFHGTNAAAWVEERGPLPIGTVLRIAAQMVDAFGAAAFHGIFHAAVTPAQLLFVRGQTPEGDWPLIKLLGFLRAHESTNDAFVSPEAAESGGADFGSEMYSLGSTLWFLLTGAAPLEGAATVSSASGIPGPVKELIAPMLATDPNDRPLDPLALRTQIDRCLAQLERRDAIADSLFITPVATRPSKEKQNAARWPLKVLAMSTVLTVAAVLATPFLPPRFQLQQLFPHNPKPLGTAVGVPENQATEPPAIAIVSPTISPNEPIVSVVTRPTEPSSEPLPDVSTEETPAPVVAANEQSETPVEEPPPPTEGPEETPTTLKPQGEASAPTSETGEAISETERAAPTPSLEVSPPPSRVEEMPRRAQPAAKVSRPAPLSELANPPRARQIWTTRNAEPAFGVPATGSLATPAPSPTEPARLRKRPVAHDRDSGLPILPALPPDE